mmetsp:Transcript_32735/g.101344  ORF Transcript_32735/g.101344 Transcript_32735/m.101344 type:complete len:428 (+) Transcript_32735:268-1551(+)
MRQVMELILLSVTFGDDCGLLRAGIGPEPSHLVHRHQKEYLRSAHEGCIVHDSKAADTVRWFQRSTQCPTAWAISCLDHFNCEDVLLDVSDTLRAGLKSLGLDDIITVRASQCLELVPDCLERQHLVLNANLMNASWARLLPPTSILVNMEQLVSYSLPQAIVAAHKAATDPRGDDKVVITGKRSLKTALGQLPDQKVIGVTVDDYRGFSALNPESTDYPWLEYSYKNADLAKAAGQPCVYIKPIGVSKLPVQRNHHFRGEVDFLHVGGVSVSRRRRILSTLEKAGWRAVVADGYFSDARDSILQLSTVGLNIHRHQDRRVVEVLRLLMYASQGMLIISEGGDTRSDSHSKVDDRLLELELQAAVMFVPYSRLPQCASVLLQPSARSASARERLHNNIDKLVLARQEAKLLAATLHVLFPHCHFVSS